MIPPTARTPLAWLVVGLLVALILDARVDVASCEYDACRFVSVDPLFLAVLIDPSPGQSEFATLVMHAIYFADDAAHPFTRAFLVNATIVILALPFLGWRNPVFSSPLAMAMLLLPGKEALITIGIAAFAQGAARWQRHARVMSVGGVGFGVAAVLLSRPAFVVVLVAALLLAFSWHRGSGSKFLATTVFVLLAGLSLAAIGQRAMPEGGGFDVEASLQAAGAIRAATDGYEPLAVLARAMIYTAYIFLIPVFEVFRIGTEVKTFGLLPSHVLLIGATAEWTRQVLIARNRSTIMVYIATSAIVIAMAFPFVHTRYLLPVFLFLASTQTLWSRNHTRAASDCVALGLTPAAPSREDLKKWHTARG
jgi:hypothetical protein